LLPLQILWLELFIDLATSIAFERETSEPDLMRRPPRRRDIPLLDNGLLGRITVAGGFSATCAFLVLVWEPGGPEHAQWLAYTVLVIAQIVRAYANRSLHTPVYRLPRNTFLLGCVVLVALLQFAIPYIPGVSDAFRAVPLVGGDWLIVAAVAIAPSIVAETWRTVRGTRFVA
jgi:Ca2+-transporting ATPase